MFALCSSVSCAAIMQRVYSGWQQRWFIWEVWSSSWCIALLQARYWPHELNHRCWRTRLTTASALPVMANTMCPEWRWPTTYPWTRCATSKPSGDATKLVGISATWFFQRHKVVNPALCSISSKMTLSLAKPSPSPATRRFASTANPECLLY